MRPLLLIAVVALMCVGCVTDSGDEPYGLICEISQYTAKSSPDSTGNSQDISMHALILDSYISLLDEKGQTRGYKRFVYPDKFTLKITEYEYSHLSKIKIALQFKSAVSVVFVGPNKAIKTVADGVFDSGIYAISFIK